MLCLRGVAPGLAAALTPDRTGSVPCVSAGRSGKRGSLGGLLVDKAPGSSSQHSMHAENFLPPSTQRSPGKGHASLCSLCSLCPLWSTKSELPESFFVPGKH